MLCLSVDALRGILRTEYMQRETLYPARCTLSLGLRQFCLFLDQKQVFDPTQIGRSVTLFLKATALSWAALAYRGRTIPPGGYPGSVTAPTLKRFCIQKAAKRSFFYFFNFYFFLLNQISLKFDLMSDST